MADHSASSKSAGRGGSSKALVLALIVIALLGGAGAGAYLFWYVRPASAAAAPPPKAASKEAASEEARGIVPLETFVVNLADPGGLRYLRVTLSLMVASEDEAKKVDESDVAKTTLRAAVLEQLAQQTSDQLVTPEGKAALKKVIAEHAAHSVHDLTVVDVLFTEFIVQ